MKKRIFIPLAVVVTGTVIIGADWPTRSGGPQREGWARSEKIITKENVKGLELIYRYHTDNESNGLFSLTSPLIDGMLITYRGFKEMLVFGGTSDNVYAVDADLNRLIWKTHFEYKGDGRRAWKSSATCPGGLTASVAMAGSSSAGVSFGRRPATAAAGTSPSAPIGGSGFGSVGAFFAVSSDGYVHTLNPSTGDELIPPAKFLPSHSRVNALNVYENVIYASTTGNCGGSPNAVYAIDLGSAEKKVFTLPVNGDSVAGADGTAIGNDGTVYVQLPSEIGESDKSSHQTVLALNAGTLAVKDYFVSDDSASVKKRFDASLPTPMVFSWNGKDMIVAATRDGRLCLLDSTALGGPDHHKPVFQTEPIASDDARYTGNSFRSGFSSWNDAANGVRWIYASLWGPPRTSAKFPLQNGDIANGSIVAFKLEETHGQPVLTPAWISPDISSPTATVTAGGLVFALSTGEPKAEVKPNGKIYSVGEIEKHSTHAVLFALDAETGKQLYASGDAVSSPSHNNGLALANGRIYFGTSDNNMNAFGFSKMQPQLTDK